MKCLPFFVEKRQCLNKGHYYMFETKGITIVTAVAWKPVTHKTLIIFQFHSLGEV